MKLHRYASANEFYPRAKTYLLEREAQHNIIIGICTMHMLHPETIREQPYFALVEHESGQILTCAVMTPPFNLTIGHTWNPEALTLLADDVFAFSPTISGVAAVKETSRLFANLWSAKTGTKATRSLAMRAYQLNKVIPIKGIAGYMRRAVEADRALLSRWITAFGEEALPDSPPPDLDRLMDMYLRDGVEDVRGYYIWEVDGLPVAMAGYTGPTPNGMRINAVYTPPELRRRGYASALVAALSQYLLDSGRRFCFLFTDLSNPTSNKIYQEIGYHAVCDVDEYKFS